MLKKQVMDLLPEAEKATTTKGLQTVSKYEIERRKSLTRGQYLYKAGGRALPDEERKKRDRKFREKLERQAARTPQGPQSMPATPWRSASQSPFLPIPPFSAGNKQRWEDDGLAGSDVDQLEPASKRGRIGTSSLNPRSQSYSPASQTVPEDLLRQAPKDYDSSSTASTLKPYQGQPGPDAAGLGLDVGEGVYVNPQNLSSPPQQPEATITEGFAPTEDFQNDTLQIDYRFVDPQSPLEQLRVQAALFYPRAHYYALTGENAPLLQGTYADQHYQLSVLLAQNWMLEDALPSLADVGPWTGSFDMVPAPNLPDEVLWTILNPIAGDTGIGLSVPTSNSHAQDHPANVGADNFQTAADLDTGIGNDRNYNYSSADLFGELSGSADDTSEWGSA